MQIKYNLDVDNEVILKEITKFINRIYRLLPDREEGKDWKSPLQNIIEEVCGFYRLMPIDYHIIFSVLCKLEGLYNLDNEDSFGKYRSSIFEILSLLSQLKGDINNVS